MIRDDILWTLNLALLPLAGLAAYYSVTFQRYMARKGYDDQPKGMMILVRSISVLTCSIFIMSGLWMAWDLGFMSLTETRDMGILTRALFLFGVYLCCEFHRAALETTGFFQAKLKEWFSMGILIYISVVFMIMIKL